MFLFWFQVALTTKKRIRHLLCLQPVQTRFRTQFQWLPASNVAPEVKAQQADTSDLVVSVDGKILKKSELEKNLKARMEMLKDKIPADKQKEVQENLRKQLVDAFVSTNPLI